MKRVFRVLFSLLMVSLIPLTLEAQEVVEQVYYENGNLESISYCSGDDVYIISYYENGNVKEKAFYCDMERDGKFLRWHENGEINLSVEYSNNKPDGQWKVYNNEGLLIGSAIFDNGELINGSIWNTDGKVIATR